MANVCLTNVGKSLTIGSGCVLHLKNTSNLQGNMKPILVLISLVCLFSSQNKERRKSILKPVLFFVPKSKL